MVYVQLPIMRISEVVDNGTNGIGKIKGVFPVPYFGKYKVKILSISLNMTAPNSSASFLCIKSQVLNNPGSPAGVLAFIMGATTNFPTPYEFESYINGSIDYEIHAYNPYSTDTTNTTANAAVTAVVTAITTACTNDGGTSPNYTYGLFKYAMLTLELTKIED